MIRTKDLGAGFSISDTPAQKSALATHIEQLELQMELEHDAGHTKTRVPIRVLRLLVDAAKGSSR